MFKTDLVLRIVDGDAGLARLDAPLVWDSAEFGYVEVPAGTVTDLGSTPQALHFVRAFDPWRTGRKSAVVHDYLYRNGKWPDGRPVTRAEADRFLRVAMQAEGHWSATAASWWFGVRSCGWIPWRDYRIAERDISRST